MAFAERMRPLLGTFVSVRARCSGRCALPDAGQAIALAFDCIARVQRLMSAQDPASDVSRINRAAPGEAVAVDSWTLDVLRRARRIWEATGGLFDCCAAGGHDGRFADLEILPGAVRQRRCVRLTLDGIAKGFAVDRAVAALQEAGVPGGAVNAGGDLRIFGPEPEPVNVRHPADPRRLVFIGAVCNAAVATSALYFSSDGSSLVDPRTGRARFTDASATVIARDCMTADALTKAVLLDPCATSRALAKLGARAVVLDGAEAAA